MCAHTIYAFDLMLTPAPPLQFALVLEHLESTFYSQALSNFTESDFEKAGYASNIRANIEQISMDENQHVEFLVRYLCAFSHRWRVR